MKLNINKNIFSPNVLVILVTIIIINTIISNIEKFKSINKSVDSANNKIAYVIFDVIPLIFTKIILKINKSNFLIPYNIIIFAELCYMQ